MAVSKLKIDIRRNSILKTLRSEGKVSVLQLSQQFGTTPVTIRNDLSALERDGYLLRVQGGAVVLPSGNGPRTGNAGGDISHMEEKAAIAELAAAQIQNGDTLFINSGTTTDCLADALRGKKDLNIVTNSLGVATRLGGLPSIRVVLLGGRINTQYGFTYGGDAHDQLSRYQADWVILAVEGVSLRGGITTRHTEEAILDRMMLSGAKKALILADHSKIEHTGFARVQPLGEGIALVTDAAPTEPALQELAQTGVRILHT